MLNSLDCKIRAAECEKMAENAPNPRVQAILRDMARTWTRLALESEQTLKQSRPPLQLIRFLQDTSLGPEEIAVLVAVYEAALRELDLTGHTDPGAETLARGAFSVRGL